MVHILPRATPEAQGIASSAILDFVEAADTQLRSLHSVIVVRHGAVVAEGWWQPYAPDQPHMMYSLSKSFTSTAVGLLVAEGGISIDDTVVSFFPDETPAEISPNLQAMTVRHLLSMSTGHDVDTLRAVITDPDGDWARAFLAQPVEHTPGTHFVYNSGATYMLSEIVQRSTGMRVLDYLGPRLFEPLGITNSTWEQSPRGVDTGGWGLNITTEDIARFGQMYLDGGKWGEQQIVPADWVAEATAKQVENPDEPAIDWSQGYGYQFWRARHNAYRGDGAFGQFCVVIPDHDVVVAITSGLQNMQEVLDLVWAHLLPAFGDSALPDDAAAQSALKDRLASLALPTPTGAATSPLAAKVSGKRYALESNDQGFNAFTFHFEDGNMTLELETSTGTYTVEEGYDLWLGSVGDGPAIFDGLTNRSQRMLASGAWTADDTFVMQWCLYQTPYIYMIRAVFTDDRVSIQPSVNVSFGPTTFAPIAGHAQSVEV